MVSNFCSTGFFCFCAGSKATSVPVTTAGKAQVPPTTPGKTQLLQKYPPDTGDGLYARLYEKTRMCLPSSLPQIRPHGVRIVSLQLHTPEEVRLHLQT